MKPISFDRNKHTYKNAAFVELVKDAIRFFNGTPVHPLPPSEIFMGTGVYALYYTGQNNLYRKYAKLNRLAYNYPIYVGKAIPKGWRQARLSDNVHPGRGHYEQAKSDWDVIHPGRSWADRCNGVPRSEVYLIDGFLDRHFYIIA